MKSSDGQRIFASNSVVDRLRTDGHGDVLLAAVERKLSTQRRRARAIRRGAAAGILLLLTAAWVVPYARLTSTLEAPVAQRRSLALVDGSRVELNAQSVVRTDFRYGRRELRIEHGEVFLSVAKDPARPFVVITPAGEVHVTGTEFNVRLSEDHRAEVTLLEGSVAVRAGGGAPAVMTPGQLATLQNDAVKLQSLGASELENAVAWRSGLIVLDGINLAVAAEKFAHFHGRRIEVDPDAAPLRLGGTYTLDDLKQFLDALRATRALTVLEGDEGRIRIVSGVR
jgi:transmembrane sensor